MLPTNLLILVVVISAYGEEKQVKEIRAKEKDQIVLSIGNGSKRWEREVNVTAKEYILNCDLGDLRLRCRKFVTKDISELETRARVLKNGSLVIDMAKVTDTGLYFPLKEERKKFTRTGDSIKLIVEPTNPIETIYH